MFVRIWFQDARDLSGKGLSDWGGLTAPPLESMHIALVCRSASTLDCMSILSRFRIVGIHTQWLQLKEEIYLIKRNAL